jgi:hypothetical protein
MPENFAMYARTDDELPHREMLRLADDVRPTLAETDRGLTYTYTWPDLTILVSVMPAIQLADHLNGFEGYIRQYVYEGNVPPRGEQIIDRIRETRLVVGVEAQPERDAQGRADELIGRMSRGLHPIIFHADGLYAWTGRVLLGPDGSFDPEAEID